MTEFNFSHEYKTPETSSPSTLSTHIPGSVELSVPPNPVEQQTALFFDNPMLWLGNEQAHQFWQDIRKNDPTAWRIFRHKVKLARSEHKINLSDIDELTETNSGHKQSAAEKIAAHILAKVEPWHDEEGTTYVSTLDKPRKNFLVDGRDFKEFANALAYCELSIAPGNETLKTIQTTISAAARFEGKQYKAWRRVALQGDCVYIDTGRPDWSAFCVHSGGWSIETTPPVRFIRPKGTSELPAPSSEPNLNLLWDLVNVEESNRLLVLAWMLETFRADTPYLVLEIAAEQGSGKSSTQDMLRRFVDPNVANLRGAPRDERDWVAMTKAGHVISLENLSGLNPSEQDLLCRITTGAAISARQLYSDGDEVVHHLHNPVVLNGIVECCTRPDLLDRAIVISPPRIEKRVTQKEIEAKYAKTAGHVMAGLLDLLSATLRHLPDVHIDPAKLQRMADFCLFGDAMARALGYPVEHFLALYTDNRKEAITRVIDGSPVAQACIRFTNAGNSHNGTFNELLESLGRFVDQSKIERTEFWPKSATSLAKILKRYAPALRQIGVMFETESKRRRDGYHCTLRKAETPKTKEVRL